MMSASVPSSVVRLLPMLAMLLSGCGSLLPEARADLPSQWKDFDAAQAAIKQVIPLETHRTELDTLGFNPQKNPNVVILNYADVLHRFLPTADARVVSIDSGLQSCLAAAVTCQGLEVKASGEHNERVGNFWLDFFDFRRKSHITGWNFNAIILLKGDLVVYKTWGGEPYVEKNTEQHNPLGPLQSLGDTLPHH